MMKENQKSEVMKMLTKQNNCFYDRLYYVY